MDEKLLNLALDITQRFGPERATPRDERIKDVKPEITDEELARAFALCDEIESYAFDLAEKVRDDGMSMESFRIKLEAAFPLLTSERLDKTLSQAMYFSLK